MLFRSVSQSRYEGITGITKSWSKIHKSIRNAKELGLIVRLNCTVCNINYAGLEEYSYRVLEIQPTGVNFIPLNYWEGAINSGAEISYKDMSFYLKKALDILKGVDLTGANLTGANLTGANLKGASLYKANLEKANLEKANLEKANLEGAYLTGAYLTGAYLTGANLEGACLIGAYLHGLS